MTSLSRYDSYTPPSTLYGFHTYIPCGALGAATRASEPVHGGAVAAASPAGAAAMAGAIAMRTRCAGVLPSVTTTALQARVATGKSPAKSVAAGPPFIASGP